MMLTFDLPTPPSVNSLYGRFVMPGGKKKIVKSKKGRDWCEEAGWLVLIQIGPMRRPVFSNEVHVDILICPGRDIDNILKILLDLMTSLQVWTDDQHVVDLRVRRADIAGCRISISDAEMQTQARVA